MRLAFVICLALAALCFAQLADAHCVERSCRPVVAAVSL